jgi:hypothetical protein
MAYTTINKSTDYFNTKLYTGNGSSQNISGLDFKPDFTWIKSRSLVKDHDLYDIVRGVDKPLESNTTGAEQDAGGQGLTSFRSDGFAIGSRSTINTNSATQVAWNWLAGGSQGSSNTAGSINTTYTSVNTTAGFSISKYTGTGSNATVGHGLGAVPKIIIVKNLNASQPWWTYSEALGAGKQLRLSGTDVAGNDGGVIWNNTAPTSSVFSVGTNTGSNGSSNNIIAYCFAEKTGYSKFGSWTSNNSANGTFVYTGFAPSFVMLKESDGTNQWVMYDNKRPGYNQTSNALFANGNDAEPTDLGIDILSNGYKIRATNNQNTGNYIYMAFGQSLVGSNNVPCTAR